MIVQGLMKAAVMHKLTSMRFVARIQLGKHEILDYPCPLPIWETDTVVLLHIGGLGYFVASVSMEDIQTAANLKSKHKEDGFMSKLSCMHTAYSSWSSLMYQRHLIIISKQIKLYFSIAHSRMAK